MLHLGDITKINGALIEPVDVITFGAPCQDLSIAGTRKGMSHSALGHEETTRSGLFMEAVRIIKEMRGATNGGYPSYAIWENVPGAFSSNKGEDFRIVLEELAKTKDETIVIPGPPKGKWHNAGQILGNDYSIAWRTHDARFWGVPQRRRRISVIMDLRGSSAPEILFEQEGMRGDSAEGRLTWESPSTSFTRSPRISNRELRGDYAAAENLMCFEPGDMSRLGGYVYGNISGTIRADMGDNLFCVMTPHVFENYQHGGYKEGCGTLRASGGDIGGGSENLATIPQGINYVVRRITPTECERLQGYPDGWTDIGDWVDGKGKLRRGDQADGHRYKALGNSIALPFWYWLFDRMKPHLPEKPTLGSLFDGIGGFPLCWESVFANHLVKWGSEIEDFPIAVTNKMINFEGVD